MVNTCKITQNHANNNFTKDKRCNNGNSFAKGNTIGRMKKKGFTLTDLNKVVVAYEKTHKVTILKHYVE